MNNGSGAGRVELLFAFHSAREFAGLTLHLARPARHQAAGSVASELTACTVDFALDKDNYVGKSVRYPVHQSTLSALYNVTVDLRRRAGRYLRVRLEFSGQWLLMSEITFHSRE